MEWVDGDFMTEVGEDIERLPIIGIKYSSVYGNRYAELMLKAPLVSFRPLTWPISLED